MRRLAFLLVFLTGCAFDSATATRTEELGEGSLRIVAANLSAGSLQSYDTGEGIRILQGTDADVVLIQELKYGDNSPAAIRQLVDTAFDPSFHYYREGGAQIPNGIISRYPIVAAGEWDDPYLLNRDFAWARIDVPGPRDLWAISVHFYAQSSTTRDAEAASLVSYIQANVPAEDYLVIGGDLNTGWRGELAFTTLAQVVDVAGPFPVDQAGNANTNTSRYRPYDHVLVDADLRAAQVPTQIGASTFTDGLVVDTRLYSPIEELWPALATDSAAYNMQHMAVIKDFLLSQDTAELPPVAPPSVTLISPNGGERWDVGTTQQITWSAANVSAVEIEYSRDGITWLSIIDEFPADAGSYAWTVPAPEGAAWVRVTDVETGVTDSSDGALAIAGTPRVFMNEILANEAGTDATREHVELLNDGTGTASLAGWTISDAYGVRYVFPSDATIEPGRARVVVAALGLNNSSDTVTVRDANGIVVDSFAYTSSLASYDGVSMNRSPDGTFGASFVLHTALSSAPSSAGTRADGTAF